MTNERAIEILKRKTTIPGDGYSFDDISEALDMAISALEDKTYKSFRWKEGLSAWYMSESKQSIQGVTLTSIDYSNNIVQGVTVKFSDGREQRLPAEAIGKCLFASPNDALIVMQVGWGK